MNQQHERNIVDGTIVTCEICRDRSQLNPNSAIACAELIAFTKAHGHDQPSALSLLIPLQEPANASRT